MLSIVSVHVFFFNDTATTEIYTLSLHDALPIWILQVERPKVLTQRVRVEVGAAGDVDLLAGGDVAPVRLELEPHIVAQDRKSTRLNSSHANISYAVFCLKKTKKKT